jgi:hypothetical protein
MQHFEVGSGPSLRSAANCRTSCRTNGPPWRTSDTRGYRRPIRSRRYNSMRWRRSIALRSSRIRLPAQDRQTRLGERSVVCSRWRHSGRLEAGSARAVAAAPDRNRQRTRGPWRWLPFIDGGDRHHDTGPPDRLHHRRTRAVRARPYPRAHTSRACRRGRTRQERWASAGDHSRQLRRARALIAQGLTVREAAACVKIGKTALYTALCAKRGEDRGRVTAFLLVAPRSQTKQP